MVDSSFDDRLGVLSPDGSLLACVSDRSGRDEIWLWETQSRAVRKLTQFDDTRYYYDLQWSPDSEFLAAMTINQLDLIDSQNGQSRRLDLPLEEMMGLSWRDARKVSFSVKRNGRWRIFDYDIAANRLIPNDSQAAFVHYGAVPEDTLWVDQDEQLGYGAAGILVKGIEGPFFERRRFVPQKKADQLFWVQRDASGQKLMTQDLRTGTARVVVECDLDTRFSIGADGLYFSKPVSYSTDIFRTLAQ